MSVPSGTTSQNMQINKPVEFDFGRADDYGPNSTLTKPSEAFPPSSNGIRLGAIRRILPDFPNID
jgi:hypothetical protein